MDDKNTLTSLIYWYPRLQGLEIPMPKTEIIRLTSYMNTLELVREVETAADKMGYPVFMRTDLCSGKHDWKNTCFIPNRETIFQNVLNLLSYNAIAGMAWSSICIREFLTLETTFTAFPGDMPINKERRYFIRDGEILCHHPYWPDESFRNYPPADPQWVEKLAALNLENDFEVSILSVYARQAAKYLPGCWSIDFAKTASGTWFLIDAAVGYASYHWPGCKNQYIRENR